MNIAEFNKIIQKLPDDMEIGFSGWYGFESIEESDVSINKKDNELVFHIDMGTNPEESE